MDFTWLEYRYAIVGHRNIKEKVGVWIRKPDSIWCDHHVLHSAQHLIQIELIRLLIVDCGMVSHSSSMAVRSSWIFAGTETRCRTHLSRASQTCSMGNMSGEYARQWRTGIFSASNNCVQILVTLSCWNMRWRRQMNGTTMDLRSLSRYLCAFKLPSIKCSSVRCP